ncbi:MAG: response regulator [Coriobacteriia bacterium]|nr:response regulator [Coriobacteriia bacterium]
MAKKVLVVDDEPAIANLAKIKLTNQGFDVTTANSGKEALASVASDPPDVMVLDVMMPGMDGWEVASRMKGDPDTKHIPILMLTALGLGEESRPEFVNVDEYYTKPFDGATLVKIVRRLAGRDD